MEKIKISYNLLSAGFYLILIFNLLIICGCQSVEKKQKVSAPVFYPDPPDKPRLQFLKSISGSGDIGGKTKSSFETFIVGEEEKKESILKPYGMALFQNKLYVCDVGKGMIEVVDLEKHTFGYLTQDRRISTPINIEIEPDGTKYVTDSTAKSIFVFDQNDVLSAIYGREMNISPVDIAISGDRCYVTDSNSNQIVILNKKTGEILDRFGKNGEGPGEFKMISNIALDKDGNIYVTDMIQGQITKFDSGGRFIRTFGQMGLNIDEFVRPKGIEIDKDNRIWVADASTEVVKIIDSEGRLLLFFGLPGNAPGKMNLPAKVILDYEHVNLFQKYAVEGAKLEFLVLVSNQFGLNKINVYGFGSFPESAKPRPQEKSN